MRKKARISVYLEGQATGRLVGVAAVKRGTPLSRCCGGAAEDHPARDGEPAGTEDEIKEAKRRLAFLEKVHRLRKKIGPIGIDADDLVRAGRRR
ncbi:MAG: hypothetical protein HY673_22445 [Chloroflexi bacterium]|nr:hypothetical protein [Chloroflexota bacterium]